MSTNEQDFALPGLVVRWTQGKGAALELTAPLVLSLAGMLGQRLNQGAALQGLERKPEGSREELRDLPPLLLKLNELAELEAEAAQRAVGEPLHKALEERIDRLRIEIEEERMKNEAANLDHCIFRQTYSALTEALTRLAVQIAQTDRTEEQERLRAEYERQRGALLAFIRTHRPTTENIIAPVFREW